MATTKKQKLPHFTLHQLIVQLSYWGTVTRVLLIAFIAFAIGFIRVLDQQGSSDMSLIDSLLNEGQLFVYTVGSFAILDIGYVIIARAYRLAGHADIAHLLFIEGLLALLYFLPYLVVVSDWVTSTTKWVFVAVLFVLSLRLVIGMLFGKPIKK